MPPEWFPTGFERKSKNDFDSGVVFSGPLVRWQDGDFELLM
jgi:hypothetical protein